MTELRHPLLDELADAGVRHGFGTRGAPDRPEVVRPRQVHGVTVARVRGADAEPSEADAIVAPAGEGPVGVVTADCVPVLVASEDGRVVGAIHAGWRGLAAGVVEAGVRAVRERAGGGVPLRAVVGPHIGPCCYEVDAPVVDPIRGRFHDALRAAVLRTPGQREGHWMIDLGFLALVALDRSGVGPDRRDRLARSCTMCEGDFHSYRRDGASAGRLLHWVQAGPG